MMVVKGLMPLNCEHTLATQCSNTVNFGGKIGCWWCMINMMIAFEPGLEEFNGGPDTDRWIPDKRWFLSNYCWYGRVADVLILMVTALTLRRYYGGWFRNLEDAWHRWWPFEDAKDACPVAGLKKIWSLHLTDGDGVADPKDKYFNEAGPADNEGCPIQLKKQSRHRKIGRNSHLGVK